MESKNTADRISLLKKAIKSHLSDILRWTAAETPQASQAIAAMFGLAGPVAVGAMAGHTEIGIVASLGGLALSGQGPEGTFREQAPGLIYALTAGSMAMFAGTIMAGHGMITTFSVPAVAAMVGLLGSMSKRLARASAQFILSIIVATN